MNYDQMAAIGACGPGVGCYPGYPGGYPGAYGAYPFPGGNALRMDIMGRDPAQAYQAQPMVGSVPQHWDIIGQQAEGGWLQQPGPLGVTRLWWLVGAAAIGATWLAYSRGMLGGARDFDGIGGEFFF